MHFCWVCKRKFSSNDKLLEHCKESKMHEQRLEFCMHENIQKREEVRQAIVDYRSELKEIEVKDLEYGAESDIERQNRYLALQKQLKNNEKLYGQHQEDIEKAWNTTQMTHSEQPITVFDLVELDAGVSTWRGGKDMQEDRYVFDKILYGPRDEPIVGYAVFDGHSGHLCADWVTTKLFEYVQKGLKGASRKDYSEGGGQKLTEEFFKKVVHEAFILSDDEFCEIARANNDMDGTTAIVCFFWKDMYYAGQTRNSSPNVVSETTTPHARQKDDPEHLSNIRLLVANVGDSRAVMCQKKGKILDQNCHDVAVTVSGGSSNLLTGSSETANGTGSSNQNNQNQNQNQNLGSQTRIVRWSPHGPVHGLRLSEDHKPDRPDEKKRVEERGGIVQDMTGVPRVFTPAPLQIGNRLVQWGLAVSKSFGDLPLKDPKAFGGPANVTNLVSVEPEITTFPIVPGRDLMLIAACDGIWDVMSDNDSASFAFGSFRSGLERELVSGGSGSTSTSGSVTNDSNTLNIHSSGTGASSKMVGPQGIVVPVIKNPSAHAARGLVRESFQRYSLDNLTAMCVNIRPTSKWFQLLESHVTTVTGQTQSENQDNNNLKRENQRSSPIISGENNRGRGGDSGGPAADTKDNRDRDSGRDKDSSANSTIAKTKSGRSRDDRTKNRSRPY